MGSMDLSGEIREPKSMAKLRRLSTSDLTQLRNFIHNNKYALEHIADMNIHIGQIWSYIIKGGELASDEEISALKAKVDELLAAKKAKDFALADQIRDELKAAGIELTDIPNGVRWKRI